MSLELEHVAVSYGANPILRDVTARLEPGQIVGLIGPNGTGKSTLIKSIATVQRFSGAIRWQGAPVSLRDIGFMPQNSCFPENMSVGETFRTIRDVRKDSDNLDKELYDAFEIEVIAGKKTKTLSGGTSQKVNAALAFLFNPDILILDEPTASLDPIAASILKDKIVREKNKLVFITSHILSELEGIATHIIFMEEGHILFFKPVEQLLRETCQDNVSQAVMYYLKKSGKHQ